MPNCIATNNTGSSKTIISMIIQYIDSANAETVEVIRTADDARFHAFKYSLNGTDYYYVVDGVQTEWTDNLGSIGYHIFLSYDIDVILGLKWESNNWKSVDVSNDYWWAGIINDADKTLLNSLGLYYTSTYPYGVLSKVNNNFSYTFKALYSDIGETEIPTNNSDFYVADFNQESAIYCTSSYATLAKTWKCNIKFNGTISKITLYTASDKLPVNIPYSESIGYSLYTENGDEAYTTSGYLYLVEEYYTSESGPAMSSTGLSIGKLGFGAFGLLNHTGADLTIQRVDILILIP